MNGRCVAGGWGDPPEPPIPATAWMRRSATIRARSTPAPFPNAVTIAPRSPAASSAAVDPVGWIEALKAEVADGQLDVLIEAQKPEPPPMTVDEILDESDRWLAEEEAKGRRPPA